jgi:hypothetical protein
VYYGASPRRKLVAGGLLFAGITLGPLLTGSPLLALLAAAAGLLLLTIIANRTYLERRPGGAAHFVNGVPGLDRQIDFDIAGARLRLVTADDVCDLMVMRADGTDRRLFTAGRFSLIERFAGDAALLLGMPLERMAT